jgi:hypothetical protein
MMASENDQLFLGHAQIVKPLMNSEKFYFSKGSNLDAIKIFIRYKMPLAIRLKEIDIVIVRVSDFAFLFV